MPPRRRVARADHHRARRGDRGARELGGNPTAGERRVPRADETAPRERGRFARDVYTYAHAPIVAGVILSAVAMDEMALHPGDPLDAPFRSIAAAGMILYLGGVRTGTLRAYGAFFRERFVATAAILLLMLAASDVDGVILLASIDIVLLAMLVVEQLRIEGSPNNPRGDSTTAHSDHDSGFVDDAALSPPEPPPPPIGSGAVDDLWGTPVRTIYPCWSPSAPRRMGTEAEEEAMAFCAQCGSAVAPSERFCGECGAPTTETAAPSPAEPAATTSQMPPPTGPPVPSTSPEPEEVVAKAAGTGSPATASRRTVMIVGAVVSVGVVLAGALLLTGGDEQSAPTASGSSSTVTPSTLDSTSSIAATTTAAPTSTLAPTTTVAPTTAAPTTVAPTTAPPTTVAPAVPTVAAGWRPAQMIPQAQIPPFDSSWTGTPSPAITDRTGPIPDGVYWVDYVSQDSTSLALELGRFESCALLDEFVCGPGPYTETDIGPLYPAEGTAYVPLDATTRVVIEGWDCAPVVAEGNGADLAAMYAALTADFDVAFTGGLNSGIDPFDLMVAVRNDPTTPFGPPPASCDDGYSLLWRYGEAPPVLVQQIIDYETGGPIDPAALIIPTAIDLVGDQTTVYFYAGFFS